MRSALPFPLAGLLLVVGSQLGELNAADKVEPVQIAPPSNGVEIEKLEIVRAKHNGAVPEADFTNMQLEFWLPAKWKTRDPGPRHLIHLKSLNPIEDNTGQILSTPKRLNDIYCLKGEVRGDSWTQKGGDAGPHFEIRLNAPARASENIKEIRGTVEISLTKEVVLKFNDLDAINGKELEHPDYNPLKDLKLKFSIHVEGQTVPVEIEAADPRKRGRLLNWTILDRGKEPPEFSQSKKAGENIPASRTFRGRSYQGWSLQLVVLEPIETKTFDFDFKDVALP